jgi:hypothetical protein
MIITCVTEFWWRKHLNSDNSGAEFDVGKIQGAAEKRAIMKPIKLIQTLYLGKYSV